MTMQPALNFQIILVLLEDHLPDTDRTVITCSDEGLRICEYRCCNVAVVKLFKYAKNLLLLADSV